MLSPWKVVFCNPLYLCNNLCKVSCELWQDNELPNCHQQTHNTGDMWATQLGWTYISASLLMPPTEGRAGQSRGNIFPRHIWHCVKSGPLPDWPESHQSKFPPLLGPSGRWHSNRQTLHFCHHSEKSENILGNLLISDSQTQSVYISQQTKAPAYFTWVDSISILNILLFQDNLLLCTPGCWQVSIKASDSPPQGMTMWILRHYKNTGTGKRLPMSYTAGILSIWCNFGHSGLCGKDSFHRK